MGLGSVAEWPMKGGKMRFFGLKSCDTCRQALAALRRAGHEPVVTDVRGDGITASDIARIVDTFGPEAVNRASATWRALSDDERNLPVAELLARHPTVMKRPVIEAEGVWTIGWDSASRLRWNC